MCPPKWASAPLQSLRSSTYITNQGSVVHYKVRDLSGHTGCITESLYSNRLLVLILTLPFTKSEPISFSVKWDFAVLCLHTKTLQGSLRAGAGLESEALV